MNIGIPKETKIAEGRVALTPRSCEELIVNGHKLYMQQGAGLLSGFKDSEYRLVGVSICSSAEELYQSSQLIVKVKEPLENDLIYLTSQHILFCFLHLAANEKLANDLSRIGLTAIGFESVREHNQLPILKPMSEIAGKLSVQIGTTLLHQYQGGVGLLLGGLSVGAIDKGQVLVLGAGSAGKQAALLARKMGAHVFVYDKSLTALAELRKIDPLIQTINNENDCLSLLETTNLLVGALHIAGKKSPRFIKRSHLKLMMDGAVIVDISVDQGGCIETTRPTSYNEPTFVEEGVIHFCVANMPGAVPRTATQALSAVLPAYIHRLTQEGWGEQDAVMKSAINVKAGKVLINLL
ncbi:MAG: alanine dehydrogenase [Cycloclasticus sp.]|jgi:alanine dehydrogenase|nr:alanine dehydrogenase [Cycloclasticus sp.]MEE4291236.1 alanine dehydrogenase [Cycloclasticus sp.]